jgi:hypothetical protein
MASHKRSVRLPDEEVEGFAGSNILFWLTVLLGTVMLIAIIGEITGLVDGVTNSI